MDRSVSCVRCRLLRRYEVEFYYPPKDAAPRKLAFRWTTPEVKDLNAARESARMAATTRGFVVRAANVLAASNNGTQIIVYVTKGIQ